jgi:hypothetical protein
VDCPSMISDFVAPLLGGIVVDVRVTERGHPRISIESHRPATIGERRVWRGRLVMHSGTSAWRVDSPQAVLAGKGDSPRRIDSGIGALVGKRLSSLVTRGPAMDTTVVFEELAVRIFPVVSGESMTVAPPWLLNRGRDGLLKVGPGTMCTVSESADSSW